MDDEEIEVTTSGSAKGDKKRFEVKKVRHGGHDSLLCFLKLNFKILRMKLIIFSLIFSGMQ